MVEIHAHGGHASQLAPLSDVFHVGLFAATGGLDVENVYAVGGLVETGVIVFDLHVACEVILGPQHHVVGVVFKLRSGGEFHAVGTGGDGANFAVEEPLPGPVAGAVVGESGLPVCVVCRLESCLFGGLC